MFPCELCKKNGILYERENLVPHIKKHHPEINGDSKKYKEIFPCSKLRNAPKTSFSNKQHLATAISKSISARKGKPLSDNHRELIGTKNKNSLRYKSSRVLLSQKYKNGDLIHRHKFTIDKKTLEELYSKKRMLTSQISKQFGVSRGVIRKNLVNHKIPIRKHAENLMIFYSTGKNEDLTQHETEVITGELLGDGGIKKSGPNSIAYYVHSCKYKEHLDYLISQLPNIGWCGGGVKERKNKQNNKSYYFLTSKVHPSLTVIFEKFYKYDSYKKYIKHIPCDLQLTQTILKHWFFGDGCLYETNGSWRITLATNCFKPEEISLILLPQLIKMGIIDCKLQSMKNGSTIIIGSHSIEKFFEIVGFKSPISCYNYKYRVVPIKFQHLIVDQHHFGNLVNNKELYLNSIFQHYRKIEFPYQTMDHNHKQRIYKQLINEQTSDLLIEDNIIKNNILGVQLATLYQKHIYGIKRYDDQYSAIDIFNDDEKLKKILDKIYDKYGLVTDSRLRTFLTMGRTYTPNNFRPLVAKFVYETYSKDGDNVLDPCCGFGGRLLGCMVAGEQRTYYGIEPEQKTYDGLLQMAQDVNPYFKTVIQRSTFESAQFDTTEMFNLIFTSPPYYNQESYNSNNKMQSSVKHNDYEKWKAFFLSTFIYKSYGLLKKGGYLCVVINDVQSLPLIQDTICFATKLFELERTYKIQYKTNPFVQIKTGQTYKYEPLLIFKKLL